MEQIKLRPSAASRWLICPGSVALSASMPYQESGEAAKIGTAIHSLAESCWQLSLNPLEFVGSTVEGITITTENAEFAQAHLDEIKRIETETGGNVMIEQYLSAFDEPHAKVGGTADVVGWNANKLIIADLKTGMGYVDADSDQMKIYAIGAINKSKKMFDIVEMRIVQPRVGPVRTFTMSGHELTEWYSNTLGPAVDAISSPNPPYNPSPDACQWCPGKAVCPTQKTSFIEVAVAPNLPTLSDEEIGAMLTKVEIAEGYIKALREYAVERIKAGAVIKGWQMVPKRATRTWVNEAHAASVLGELLGEDKLYPKEMISPAAAEKLLNKEDKYLITDLTAKVSSGLTLGRAAGIGE